VPQSRLRKTAGRFGNSCASTICSAEISPDGSRRGSDNSVGYDCSCDSSPVAFLICRMCVKVWTKLSSAVAQSMTEESALICATIVGQNCPLWDCRIQCRFAVGPRTETFSDESIFRGEIETRASRRRHIVRLRVQQRKLPGTAIADGEMQTVPKCVFARSTTSISGTRNSRLSGQEAGCTGHDRGHSSLVGTRRLHSELGAKNCGDRRRTRQTRFPRKKAISRQNILPRLLALSRDASATAATKLYS